MCYYRTTQVKGTVTTFLSLIFLFKNYLQLALKPVFILFLGLFPIVSFITLSSTLYFHPEISESHFLMRLNCTVMY